MRDKVCEIDAVWIDHGIIYPVRCEVYCAPHVYLYTSSRYINRCDYNKHLSTSSVPLGNAHTSSRRFSPKLNSGCNLHALHGGGEHPPQQRRMCRIIVWARDDKVISVRRTYLEDPIQLLGGESTLRQKCRLAARRSTVAAHREAAVVRIP